MSVSTETARLRVDTLRIETPEVSSDAPLETIVFDERYATREKQKAELMRCGGIGRHDINTIPGMPPRFVEVVGYEPFGLVENESSVSGYFLQYLRGEHSHLGNRNKRPLSGGPETVAIRRITCTSQGIESTFLHGFPYENAFAKFLMGRYQTTKFTP